MDRCGCCTGAKRVAGKGSEAVVKPKRVDRLLSVNAALRRCTVE